MVEASLRWMQHHSVLKSNDGVILGASSLNHFNENLKALRIKEPLPDSIVQAFEEAWKVCKGDTASYFKDENYNNKWK